MTGPTREQEERVRAALDGLAGAVVVSSDAYRGAQAEWRRRERRRRRVALLAAAVVVALTVVVGLWSLNREQPRDGVIFNTGTAHSVGVFDGPDGVPRHRDRTAPAGVSTGTRSTASLQV